MKISTMVEMIEINSCLQCPWHKWHEVNYWFDSLGENYYYCSYHNRNEKIPNEGIDLNCPFLKRRYNKNDSKRTD